MSKYAPLQRLLTEASGLGIQIVGIGVKHPLLDNEHFPWPEGSLFVPGRITHGGTWPAVWELAERAGIWGGVGNYGQAFIDRVSRKSLPDGVWQLQADGWVRIA